ncbi:MAG: type II secretion system protein [Fimbriimonadaceae bacterium]|nr:type II secretion system protein [Fimbriimonadaceae bacterium]
MNTRRATAAFTLIEMLVVIVMLSLVLAITVRSLKNLEVRNSRTETVARLKAVSLALRLYRDDWGDVPPYNPTAADYDGDGNADPSGPGLWALYYLDYLPNYRMLTDANRPPFIGQGAGGGNYGGNDPWVDDGAGGRYEVVPNDPLSMGTAFNAYASALGEPAISPVGRELTPREEYLTYTLLARPAAHVTPAVGSGFGTFNGYAEENYENWCSWMMQDPYTREWKYRPVRATQAVGGSGTNSFPAGDSAQPLYYHRQLSHRWTDDDSPRYLPASDTVVTWSSLFRIDERRSFETYGEWGCDVVLYEDGHIEIVRGPADAADARAVLRPTAP